jgi:DNA repair protein RecN (Recombination protein N)
MLIGLSIRDVVLIESLDLAIGPGLTALTGETGAGKSIILDALGLATGQRADSGLVRRGANQAVASAVFAPRQAIPSGACWTSAGCTAIRARIWFCAARWAPTAAAAPSSTTSRPGVGVLRELGALLLEVHGQHETVGLLDARTHRPMLDGYAGAEACWRGPAIAGVSARRRARRSRRWKPPPPAPARRRRS